MSAVSHETSQTMSSNFRPEIDYRRLLIASGEALHAVERGVLSDAFGAFERMHAAAGMGPMDWGGSLAHPLTMACAETGALLTSGRVDLGKVGRVLTGLTRNVDAADRFRIWHDTDAMLRGARRMYLYSLKRSIVAIEDRLAKFQGDFSSLGIQRCADYRAEMDRLTRLLDVELIVAGLATDAVTR